MPHVTAFPRKVAVFDFDGTICPGDSIVPFLYFALRNKYTSAGQVVHAAGALFKHKLGLIPMEEAKLTALSFVCGKAPEEINAFSSRFIQEVLRPRFRKKACTCMENLRSQGYCVLLVSASMNVYMRKMPDFLPCDDVICTEMSEENGVYVRRLGPNCRDEEKVSRIRAYIREHKDLQPVPDLGFGDSRHDIPMLKNVNHPVLVTPDRALRKAFPQAEIVKWS